MPSVICCGNYYQSLAHMQVVCNEQLVLYCKGNSTSFSVRLVQQANPEYVLTSEVDLRIAGLILLYFFFRYCLYLHVVFLWTRGMDCNLSAAMS